MGLFDKPWLAERQQYFAGLREDIKNIRDEGKFACKRIATVGSWNNAVEVRKILESLGLSLSCIADNNPAKQAVSRIGIISQSVKSLRNEDSIVILVINNIFWVSIRHQLLRLGFREGEEFFVVFGGEYFRRQCLARTETAIIPRGEYDEFLQRAKDGYASYCQMAEIYPNLPIWLMHQPSIGDLYIFAMFLPAAMGRERISDCDCVLVVTKNSTRRLAIALGFKYIEMITFEEANRNWLMMLRLIGDRIDVHNAVFHGLNGYFQTLVHYSKVSFRDSFTKYVFHFDREVTPIYPTLPKRTDRVKRQFEEHGLQIGKTVIISPYAGHFEAVISRAQWLRLVNALKAKGYSVCTNCGGPEEKPLPGTAAPVIDLQDSVEFSETAGYFIGVRSGFCDLLCMADCQMIVIYETGAPAASIDYFGFESMGIGAGSIIEVVNDCIHTDSLMDEIIAMH
jgi:hypothetical protein